MSWKVWSAINFGGWIGFELGKPRMDKTFLADLNALSKGATKGVLSSILPPLSLLYIYEEYKDWEN